MPPKKSTAAASKAKTKTAGPKAKAAAPKTKITKSEAKATTSKTKTTKTTKATKAADTSKVTKAPEKTKTTTKTMPEKSKPATGKAAAPSANESKKRKAASEERDEARPAKKVATDAKAVKAAKADAEEKKKPTPKQPVSRKKKATAASVPVVQEVKIPRGDVINEAPKQRLNVYVFGEGSSGELGLGTAKNAIDVKRPRLNPNLDSTNVGVVQIAVGGMHCAALTQDNRILTWGVNDQGALGRDTDWEGGLVDMDAAEKEDSDSDSDDDTGMNPREATPTAIPQDSFPAGTVFTEVAAGDSCTFAVTDDGHVFGWGTFRSNEGILGFRGDKDVQKKPIWIPELKKIKHIACGANHVLALNNKGGVFAWGSGQQNQLGRRVVERTRTGGLVPREFGLPKNKVKYIECGAYHSFAIDTKDQVWTWGLNSYGDTGIAEGAGDDNAVVMTPQIITSLQGKDVVHIKGGAHHSVAVTKDGDCLSWGRVDGGQLGLEIEKVPKEHLVYDDKEQPRILKEPTVVPGFKATYATAGSDTSFAITTEGQAYSWGFSANYQTGLGTDDDVRIATLIDNTAVRGKKLNWAGAGGQFSVLTEPVGEVLVNGEKKIEGKGKEKATEDGDEPMVNGTA